MNRLIKLAVFSAVVAAGSIFSAPQTAQAGYGYGYGYNSYGYSSYGYSYKPYYAPVYKYVPSYSYGYYGGYCY